MAFFGATLLMLGVLSVLIIVHELGHFWVARLFGFQTPVFGFGLPFGPYWVLGKVGDTQIRFHALLLGGYVAIPELGDESASSPPPAQDTAAPMSQEGSTLAQPEDNSSDNPYGVPLKPFRKFPIWQRALVAFAGPAFNIIFAWLIMFIIVNTFGDPSQKVIVADLPAANPIAAKAGVKVNDQIVSIDKASVDTPDDIIVYLGSRPLTPVNVHIIRDGNPLDVSMTTNKYGKVGMALVTEGPMQYRKINLNPIESAGFATEKLSKLTTRMIQGLGLMVEGLVQGIVDPAPKVKDPAKPHLGLKDLHGVLAVLKIGADIAAQDWSQLPIFVMFISMDLAIINLVPWPGLDGSHLAFMAWEAVRGKPMEERRRGTIIQWGFISLLVLMAVIMYNDIEALITGKLDFKVKQKAGQSHPAGKAGTEAEPVKGSDAGTDKGTDLGAETATPVKPSETTETTTSPAESSAK